MRTRRRGRHRVGRIAQTRPAEDRDELDVNLPPVAGESVTGEPLTERALRRLDPDILRDSASGAQDTASARADGLADAEETTDAVEPTETEATIRLRSRRYRLGRRAAMFACWSALGFVIVIVLAVTVPNALGLRDLTVLSGSMEPTIHTGDVVVERDISPLDVRLGDIVSFKDPEDPSILINHRVQDMQVHDGVVSFVTKGDANTGVERWKVSADGTLGRVELHIWRLGYLLSWIRGRLARMLLVVVPALVLGTYELVRIWRPKPGGDAEEDSDGEEDSHAEDDPRAEWISEADEDGGNAEALDEREPDEAPA